MHHWLSVASCSEVRSQSLPIEWSGLRNRHTGSLTLALRSANWSAKLVRNGVPGPKKGRSKMLEDMLDAEGGWT